MIKNACLLILFLGLGIFSGSAFVLTQPKPVSYFVKIESGFEGRLFEGEFLDKWSDDRQLNRHFRKYNVVMVRKTFRLKDSLLANIYTVVTLGNYPVFEPLLNDIDGVEYAERIPDYEIFHTPNDLHPNQWNLKKVFAEDGWDVQKDASNVTIAIVDDAVLTTHPDLSANIWVNPGEIPNNGIDDDGNGYIDDVNGWDVSDNDNTPSPPSNASSSHFSHGTHCAGIASAVTNNGIGIASLAYNAKIIGVKCKPSSSSGGSLPDAYKGVEYAIAANADVMSMSWGGGSYSKTYQTLFDIAHSKGIVLVAAAGNSNTSAPMYPASYNHVISVAASDNADKKASFSNYGTKVDVTAPGVNIWSTVPGSKQYDYKSGTSMACPLVSSLCALMIANVPGVSPDSIESCLKRSADNINAINGSYTGQLGAGRINAFRSLNCQSLEPVCDFTAPTVNCPFQPVQFINLTVGKGPMTYQWSFPGGSPSTSSAVHPLVSYSSPGTYTVTLTASNSSGSDKIVKTGYITISVPEVKFSGGGKVVYGNRAGLLFTMTGSPPFHISITDGNKTTNYTGVKASPFFIDYGPITGNTKLNVTSFGDKNCTGSATGTVNIEIFGDTCQNQVFNEDFHLMDSANCTTIGFKTDMNLDCDPPTNGARNIHITDQSYLWNGGYWSGVKDHTPGGGTGFMLGDGPASDTKVWYQNVNVIKGKTYEFSAWFVNGNVNGKYTGSSASFELRVGGLNGSLLTSFGPLGKTTPWKQYSATYKATTTGSIELDIIIKGGSSSGNDFAIDDISFKCTNSSDCLKTSLDSMRLCENDSVNLKADTGSQYSWYPPLHISSDNKRKILAFPDTSRTYTCTYLDTTGCSRIDSFILTVHPTPEIEFEERSISLCKGDTAKLFSVRDDVDHWSPNYMISGIAIPKPMVFPDKDITYYAVSTSEYGCISKDSIRVNVANCCIRKNVIEVSPDSIICVNEVLNFSSDAIYPGTSVFIWDFGPDASPPSYTGENPPPVRFNKTGTHKVSLIIQADCGSDTAFVNIYTSGIAAFAGRDTAMCEGDSLELGEPEVTDRSYLWTPSNGLSDPFISNPVCEIQSNIKYVLKVTDDITGCMAYDTVEVQLKKKLKIDQLHDSTICALDQVIFEIRGDYDSIEWQDGSKGGKYLTDGDTLVWADVSNGGCSARDSAVLTYIDKPVLDLPTDSNLCDGDSVQLDAFYPESKYMWTPGGDTASFIFVREAGWYRVEVTNVCGSMSDSTFLTLEDCRCITFVPNVFTPNGDPINPTFGPSILCKVNDYQLQIYNRWGERLFETNNPDNRWDGTFMGADVPQGVYFWILSYSGKETFSVKKEHLSGTVTLLR